MTRTDLYALAILAAVAASEFRAWWTVRNDRSASARHGTQTSSYPQEENA